LDGFDQFLGQIVAMNSLALAGENVVASPLALACHAGGFRLTE
jgi:hypothetical protein